MGEFRVIDAPRPPYDGERAKARRAVVRRAVDMPEARELLDMLGLLPNEGETP